MGKLIAKTAAITLACIIAAALLLFGIFSLFFPSVMMSLTDSLGMEGPCASYTVSVYEKTGKTEDLALAVERSYLAEHYEDAAKYGILFLQSEDFSSFCLEEDKNSGSSSQYLRGTSAQYYTGIVSVSLYHCADERAIDTAFGALGNGSPKTTRSFISLRPVCKRKTPNFAARSWTGWIRSAPFRRIWRDLCSFRLPCGSSVPDGF